MLVPGCGAGRLAWEIAELGYSVHANDLSFGMLSLAASILARKPPPVAIATLDDTATANDGEEDEDDADGEEGGVGEGGNRSSFVGSARGPLAVYPFVHDVDTNQVYAPARRHRQRVLCPDVYPSYHHHHHRNEESSDDGAPPYVSASSSSSSSSSVSATLSSPFTPRSEGSSEGSVGGGGGGVARLSLQHGDFEALYRSAAYAGFFDVVVTNFFLDTAANPLAYLAALRRCLKPRTGRWVMHGPLQWHSPRAVMLSLDELKSAARDVGFVVEAERRTATYYGTTHMAGGGATTSRKEGGGAGGEEQEEEVGEEEVTMRPDIYRPIFFIARRVS